MVSYLMVSNSIARYYVVGFGARAVSRKTPIYFINYLKRSLSGIGLDGLGGIWLEISVRGDCMSTGANNMG